MAEALAIEGAKLVASTIIQSMLKDSFSYLSDGISAKLRRLETTILPQFQLVIKAAERSSDRKSELEQWLRKLKDALYEAEDVLDLYKYQAIKEKVSNLNTHPAPNTFKKVALKVNSRLSILSPHNIKLQSSLNKLEMIADETKTFLELLQIPPGADKVAHDLVGGQPNVTTSFLPDKIFGRDKDSDEIIDKYLLDTSETSESGKSYSVVAIVGIGGAGKTTLAQLVYNDQRVVDHFDIKMWVCISRNLDVFRHTREMIESATKNKCPRFDNLEGLQKKLIGLISAHKVLLVLDDVWCEKLVNEVEWENLLAPLATAGKKGSKILVTTRMSNLPRAFQPQCTMPLRDLKENVIVSLFTHHAFCGIKSSDLHLQKELEDIGKRIVQQLHKSPLAAKAVASQLSKRLEANFWRDTLERDNLHDAQQALFWSYQHLDAPLQRCFSYFSLFPKGCSFKAEEIVHLWMAEGFINLSNNNRRMEDIGMDYFYELVSNSFLQLVNVDSHIKCYKMHDLFHDLAERVSKEDCFRVKDDHVTGIPLTIRRLYVSSETKNSISFDKLENLRTLIVDGSRCNAINHLIAATVKFRRLRVLKLSHSSIERLPKAIGDLKHLRYLALDWIEVNELPSSLGKLYHLQLLHSPYDARLPRSLKNVINLRHFVGGYGALRTLPYIGRLTSLQALSHFDVKKKKGYDICQLKNLNELRGSLTISNLENAQGKDEAVEANLKDKRRLESLLLKWENNGDERDRRRDLDREVLEDLQPHPDLANLFIEGYQSCRYPSWSPVQNLRSLKLHNCPILEVLPPMSHLFPSCHELRIWRLTNLKMFSLLPENLGMLTISDCPLLIFVSEEEMRKSRNTKKSIITTMRSSQLNTQLNKHLTREEVASDCLEVMKLLESEKVDVPKDFMALATALESSMQGLDLWEAHCRSQEQRLEAIFGKREKSKLILPSSLQTLEMYHCSITDEALSQSLKWLTSLKSLELSNIKTITTLPSKEVLHHLIALTHLEISDCPWLKSLGGIHALPSLEELEIDSCLCLELEMVMSFPGEEDSDGCILPPSLRFFNITRCTSMKSFVIAAGELPNLTRIRVLGCLSLASLSLSGLTALTWLEIKVCPKLSSLSSNLPESLEALSLISCPGISSLSYLPKSLRTLYLIDCPCISSLPEHLPESLSNLKLSDCPVISSLPKYLPESLMELILWGCPGISKLPKQLPGSLNNLDLWNCPGILSLPELPESLMLIKISKCPVLEERCRSPDGDDWPKIVCIPNRNIGIHIA